jgi:phenylalanyl-tRNA synthetase beta chain
MKVSLNTVKQYIDFDLPPVDELVKRINEQLGGVEEVINLADKYKDAKIVKVVECDKHPNADRLSVCKIDDGSGELTQVVCGAPNVRADMWAVWLPPESIVPSTYGTKDEFKLGARELRGVMSNGMLAAADELAIGNDHEGILEIESSEWKPTSEEVKPGASFAKVYGLDDTIIDIENKMFTHRPDLFGQLGVAREIAGILGHQFTSPEWYLSAPEFEVVEGLELEVFNEAIEKVPRFMAVAMKDIEVKQSPLWLQCALVAMGSKPINNIVDVTNYIMLLTAQPVHAYDYDKLRGRKLGVRMAANGEKADLLNGKTYELTEDDIVIVDGEGVVGLGGIMGGGNSEVSADTKNIVLEVANFDMYTVRKSSMRHGVFTDALTRFNKGQSPLQNDRVLHLLMMSIKDVSSAKQASGVIDQSTITDVAEVRVTANFINERLGLRLGENEIKDLLTNVELNVNDELAVMPPFWRTDIELPEDIVEEVGRLYGFDKLPRELPLRSSKPAAKNQQRQLQQSLRETLAKSGANEVLTYSFVHEKILTNSGQDPAHAFKLSNALSPDLQYYRLSLTPSLLSKVHMNIKAGYDRFALFELGKTHFKDEMAVDEPSVPNEDSHVALIVACNDKQKPDGAAFYQARRIFEQMECVGGASIQPLDEIDLSDDIWGQQLVAAYDAKRSVGILYNEKIRGVIGEFTSSVRKAFKLPNYVAGFEVHLNVLTNKIHAYRPLSKYPSVSQDISLKVSAGVSYQAVYHAVSDSVTNIEYETTLKPVAVYQPTGDSASKTITLRLTAVSDEKTLRDSDVSKLLDAAAKHSHEILDAERV